MRLFYLTGAVDATLYYDSEARQVRSVVERASDAPAPYPRAAALGGWRFRLSPPGEAANTMDTLYVGTAHEWAPLGRAMVRAGMAPLFRLLSEAATARVLGQVRLPPRLGYTHALDRAFVPLEEQLDLLGERDSLRIAVVNVFHLAFGDTVAWLTTLRELRRRLCARFASVHIDLLQGRYISGVERLYGRSEAVRDLVALPAPLSRLLEYDAYFDLSLAPMNDALPWGDIFLEAVGIPPISVPDRRKRNRLPLDHGIARELAPAVAAVREGGRPLLLFHPKASTSIRSFPPERAGAFLHEVLERTGWAAASVLPLSCGHPSFVDWSPLSRTFDHMMYLVSEADMFVSVDTSLYHVADAFDVPGVVVFTSIPPEMRIAYYPYVEGISLGGEGNRLAGMHGSEDAHDVAYAHAMWDELTVDDVLAALATAVRKRDAAASGRHRARASLSRPAP